MTSLTQMEHDLMVLVEKLLVHHDARGRPSELLRDDAAPEVIEELIANLGAHALNTIGIVALQYLYATAWERTGRRSWIADRLLDLWKDLTIEEEETAS